MRLFAAATVGLLLCAVSFGLLVVADEAVDLAAIAGGTGLVISGALLGLTFLAWRWRADAPYVETPADSVGVYAELDEVMGADQDEVLAG